jgi:hypothetical protein
MSGRSLPLMCALAWLAPAAAWAQGAAQAQPPPAASTREFNIVPIAGGDSDVGLGLGEVSDWARLEPRFTPYRWRLESGAFATFKLRDGNDLISPYQDYYLLLTLPQLGPRRLLRLEVRAAFTEETTLKYFGIGNATPFPAGVPVRQTEYERVHPTVAAEVRITMAPHWFLQTGGVFTQNWLSVPPTTLLGQAAASGPPEIRSMLGTFSPHGVALIEMGAQYDSRDNETVTRSGAYHTLKARLSPAAGSWLPYAYQQVDATFRFYATPVPRWLTLSWRLVGDVLVGAPPFYELARFEETPAIGGGKALRGVPAQRYYGKVKVFENLEARSELLPFTIKGKRLVLGAALFVDAGRVWTELTTRHPELDGTGLGLKYGLGGGLRLQSGQTFVVRADVAWSPDAQPIAAYFAAGEIF